MNLARPKLIQISLDSLLKSTQLVVTTLDVFPRKQVIVQSIVKGSLTRTKISIVFNLFLPGFISGGVCMEGGRS